LASLTHYLLVTDGTGRSLSRPSESATDWSVLPIGLDARTLEREHGERLRLLGSYRILDPAAWAAEAARDVREYVVPLLHGLPDQPANGRSRLGDLLRMQEGNCWWFLEISEKSPLRGTLVQELYTIALVRRFVEDGEYSGVCMETANTRMINALRTGTELPIFASRATVRQRLTPPHIREWLYWIQAARQLFLLLVTRLVTRLGKFPASADPAAILFFTLYPAWWLAAETPAASERFFPDMPRSDGGRPFGYAAWIVGRPAYLWRHRRSLGTVMRERTIIPLQRFVPLSSALSLLLPRLFLRLRAFRRACLKSGLPRFMQFDVSLLVAAEVSRSIGAAELPLDRLLFAAVRRLTVGASPSALVFRAECQPIERAIVYGARGRAPTVGFWHSALALCDNYLPFHFPSGALRPAANPSAIAPLPLPDAMLATGEICKRTLTRQGYPASRVMGCGPIRHRELLSLLRRCEDRLALRNSLQLPADAVVLFVATSVVLSDARAMLWALADALEASEECVVVLKVRTAAGRTSRDPARLEPPQPGGLCFASSDVRVHGCV
jgi:hypothetical protein